MWLKCSLCGKNCFSLLPAIFFELPITRTYFDFPWRYELSGVDCILFYKRWETHSVLLKLTFTFFNSKYILRLNGPRLTLAWLKLTLLQSHRLLWLPKAGSWYYSFLFYEVSVKKRTTKQLIFTIIFAPITWMLLLEFPEFSRIGSLPKFFQYSEKFLQGRETYPFRSGPSCSKHG